MCRIFFSSTGQNFLQGMQIRSIFGQTITAQAECKYTVGTESIQTPLHFSLFVILQPFAKII